MLETAAAAPRRPWVIVASSREVYGEQAGVAAIVSIDLAPGDVGAAFDHLADRFAGSTPGALALASVIRWLALAALVGLGLLALRFGSRRPAVAGAMLALLAAADMLLFAHAYQPMGPKALVMPPRTPAVAYLQRHVADGRIAGVGLALSADWSTVYGLRDVRGYDAPQPSRRFYALWTVINPTQQPGAPFDVADLSPEGLRMLSLLGTRYVVVAPEAGPPPGSRLTYAYRGTDANVLENPRATPRALVAERVHVAAGAQAELATVLTNRFDSRRDAVVRRDELGGEQLAGAAGGSVRVVEEANARVVLRASLPRRALVVLGDAWARGWTVSVDGRPARALQANVVLRGVVVPAGEHTVEWRYRVPGLRAGALLSGAGAIAVLAWRACCCARGEGPRPRDNPRMQERWRVQLPRNVRPPFEVFVNGVPQHEGDDFELAPAGDALLFRRELVQEGKLGFWRWFLGAWGIGTYRRNDAVDVRYQLEGRTLVAHGLTVAPPEVAPARQD